MIKTTLGVLYAANTPSAPGSPSPLKTFASLRLPIPRALARAKMISSVDTALRYRHQIMTEVFKRYGKFDEKMSEYRINPGDPGWLEYNREVAELDLQEIEVDGDRIPVSELGSGEVSALDLMILLKFALVE
jgi:hypothetical protein